MPRRRSSALSCPRVRSTCSRSPWPSCKSPCASTFTSSQDAKRDGGSAGAGWPCARSSPAVAAHSTRAAPAVDAQRILPGGLGVRTRKHRDVGMQGDAGSGDAKILAEARLSAGVTKKDQFTARGPLGLGRRRYAPFIGRGRKRRGSPGGGARGCGRGLRQG